MPRPTRTPAAQRRAASVVAKAAKVQPNSRSLAASAANLGEDKRGAVPVRSGGAKDWQAEGWYFYDTVGEFRFACTWKSQCLSRVKLYISEDQPDGSEKRIDEGPEVDALDILFGGDAGQSQGMAQMGLHLAVPGETWLVGEVEGDAGAETDVWTIYSNEELTQKGNAAGGVRTYEIDRGDGAKRMIQSDTAIIIRIWRSHPRKWVEADSPARASIPVLRQIEQMAKRTAAQIDSRLAGAGILFLPTEMSFGSPGAEGAALDVDQFMTDLTRAMLEPIGDRGSADAVVPLVVRAPGALLDKIKHVTFASPLDEKGIEQQENAIRRLALASDMPAEVMLGLGDVNHWSAWAIDEAALKTHIEPDCELITAALTEKWLQPAVKAMGQVVNPRRRINADTSDLRLRPDRTEQAQWLYEHLELDGEGVRRELGIEGEAPTDEELKRSLLLRTAVGTATPDVVLAALKELGLDLHIVPTESRTGLPPAEVVPKGDTVAPKDPAGTDRQPPPDTGPPAPGAPAAVSTAALLAAAEPQVRRAVERANNKANNRARVRRPIPAEKLDAAMEGAWDSVPRTAELLAVDPGWLRDALDTYTRALLTEGVEHQPQVLARVLSRVPVDA